MSLKTDLDKRATALLAATASAEVAEQIDAFKAVSLYYLGTQRVTKGKPEEPGGPTFGDLVGRIKHTHTEGNA